MQSSYSYVIERRCTALQKRIQFCEKVLHHKVKQNLMLCDRRFSFFLYGGQKAVNDIQQHTKLTVRQSAAFFTNGGGIPLCFAVKEDLVTGNGQICTKLFQC